MRVNLEKLSVRLSTLHLFLELFKARQIPILMEWCKDRFIEGFVLFEMLNLLLIDKLVGKIPDGKRLTLSQASQKCLESFIISTCFPLSKEHRPLIRIWEWRNVWVENGSILIFQHDQVEANTVFIEPDYLSFRDLQIEFKLACWENKASMSALWCRIADMNRPQQFTFMRSNTSLH